MNGSSPPSARRPRFLFVIQYHFTRLTGGTEMQAWMLACELARRGWDVHYASEMNRVPEPPVMDGVILHGLPENPSYWRGNRRPLRDLMHALAPDVIYTRMFTPYLGYMVMDAPPGAFTVWSAASGYDVRAWPYLAHGRRSHPGLLFVRRMPVYLWHNYLARKGRKRAQLVLAQQRDQQRDLAKLRVRAEILRNSHPPVPESEVQRHQGKPVVLWADSIKLIKRPELFIELARRCRDLPVEFLMIGGMLHENYRPQVEAAVRELPNFRYGGFVPLSEVEQVFAGAHLHVKTSLPIEGFPNTFVQAWLHGVPVVSYENDPESLLNEHKLGVCATRFDELEQAVRDLVNHPEKRREIGARARVFARSEFDLQHNVDRLEGLLSSRGVRLPRERRDEG
ncbi:MAG: glycosyltransferase family 4 protein [bacterium]|nr:glycosyltransferase family 4 protein [bacterium]